MTTNTNLQKLVKKWRTNVCLAREEKGLLRAADELEAALSVAQGQGCVMVPRVPTEAMLNAARDWSHKKFGRPIGNEDATGCYTAMLSAALAQPDGVRK